MNEQWHFHFENIIEYILHNQHFSMFPFYLIYVTFSGPLWSFQWASGVQLHKYKLHWAIGLNKQVAWKRIYTFESYNIPHVYSFDAK